MHRTQALAGALVLSLLAAPGVAQNANPWSQRPAAPGYATAPVAPPQPATGTYAPADLEARLSAPTVTATPAQPQATPGQPVEPGAGAVVPPYAGLPLSGGYGYLPAYPSAPVAPVMTGGYPATAYPYGGGYPATAYPYGGGYPSYGGVPGYGGLPGGYGMPGYGGAGYGLPGYGATGYGLPAYGTGWNGPTSGWGPSGLGMPMGGFSPFGF